MRQQQSQMQQNRMAGMGGNNSKSPSIFPTNGSPQQQNYFMNQGGAVTSPRLSSQAQPGQQLNYMPQPGGQNRQSPTPQQQ